jgi:hypothetical protein
MKNWTLYMIELAIPFEIAIDEICEINGQKEKS